MIELVPYRGNVVVSELLTGSNDYSRTDRILDNSTQNIKCTVNYLRIGFILSYTFISLGGKVNTVMRVGVEVVLGSPSWITCMKSVFCRRRARLSI